MAAHRQGSFSDSDSSSASFADESCATDSLLAHEKLHRGPTRFSHSPASVEKWMAQQTSAASQWARGALANLAMPRRPTRLFGSLLATCALFLLLRHSGAWSAETLSDLDQRGHHIPAKIWQVMFTPPHADPDTGAPRYDLEPEEIPHTNSWIARNPGYDYTLVTTDLANAFVRKHFADRPDLLDVHFGLRNHGPRSDLMRYVLMYVEGGVYSDTDVTCMRPIDTWIPLPWRSRVKAVVGIEGDSLGGDIIPGMLWDVQFGQWTVAAAPGHRLFRQMIDSVVTRVNDLCERKGTTIDQLAMTEIEIMNATATALWSETIFNELKRVTANSDAPLEKFSDLSGMTKPRLYDDILVLPINYIASGVGHSGASAGTAEVALVKHHFSGTWRTTDGIDR